MHKHFDEEEKMLFALLPSQDVLRKKAEAQHQSIYQLVKTIKANKDQQSVLKQLADVLEEHLRFEERELFNHIQQQVPPAELEKVSSRVPNDSRKIEDGWTDVFWSMENSPGS